MRYLKRDWNHKKPHLAKYSSLPTLQLTPTERPIFQCQQCGFINTLIPMCLWCCWTSDAAHDEFHRSAPRRPRRLSAPPRTPTPNITPESTSIPQNGEQYIPKQQNTPYRGTNTTPSGDAIGKVTTPTICVRPSINRHPLLVTSSLPQTTTGKGPQSHSQSRNPTKTPRLRPSIPSFFLLSDVDRSNPTTTGMKSINPKSSRFSLFLDFNNHHNNGGRPDSNQHTHTHAHETTRKIALDDDDEHISPISGSEGERQQRTLRRKQRINVVEQAQLDVPNSGPIAISFDLELKEKQKEDESRISSESFHQNLKVMPSVRYPTSKELPQTPPPSSSPPSALPSSSPPSSPPQTTPTSIRIGHPNRPYYTAIRKNMSPPGSPSSSPPPSRPTSLIGASRPTSLIGASRPTSLIRPSSSPSRPTSLIAEGESFPPSAFHHHHHHHHQRPISSCLGGTGIGMFSPFVIDTTTAEEEQENNDNNKAREGTERGSIGFSMSGETELRMALASIQTGGSGGEFRYRETMTTTPTPTSATTPSGSSSTHDHFLLDGTGRRKRSISSGVVARVRAFRKSLKDLIGAGPKSAL